MRTTYSLMEDLQDSNGSLLLLTVCNSKATVMHRVIESDHLFGDLKKKREICEQMCMCRLDTAYACVSEKLTSSLCMNPQIPAATSQANRMTRQAKNCGRERNGTCTVYGQESVTEFVINNNVDSDLNLILLIHVSV